MMRRVSFRWLVLCALLCLGACVDQRVDSSAEEFIARGKHTNNWAVIVGSSRFWYNYRHISNALSIYHTIKRLGIADSNIILMLADDVSCNPRNVYPGEVFNDANHAINLYGSRVEVDYRGYDVTVENFLRLLTGRHEPGTPASKRLMTDENSNILIYMTGHGGNEFLKFQDAEELNSADLADAFQQMYRKQRYHEILFIIETCQANTLFNRFYSPNILAVGCSGLDENSYSHHNDDELGVSPIDRFTHDSLLFMETMTATSQHTVKHWFLSLDPKKLNSNPGYRSSLSRPLGEVLLSDFFAATRSVDTQSVPHPLAGAPDSPPPPPATSPPPPAAAGTHEEEWETSHPPPPLSEEVWYALYGFAAFLVLAAVTK